MCSKQIIEGMFPRRSVKSSINFKGMLGNPWKDVNSFLHKASVSSLPPFTERTLNSNNVERWIVSLS